eukprot:40346-Eustigmatos_ZCMA.PRE.1
MRGPVQHETLWAPLAKELTPRLADAPRTTHAELENTGGSYRRFVLQYACVLRGRDVLSVASWYRGLVLQFDFWDR